ncbi:hypothetical protein KY359_06900 [Candidatus Woesearchaeota archaeon]|nr:hypothetical protein [Candidatus Woesearchaeota archaeon]
MVFQILRGNRKKDLERRFTTFSEQLAQAFAQIKTDISEVNHRVDSNQKEMERMAQWVEYLNRANQRISEHNSKIMQNYEKITENHQKLHTSHIELVSDHSRTAEKAENLENRHQELYNTISAHKSALKSELNSQLQEHKESHAEELKRLKTWVDYLSAHMERQKAKEDDLKQDVARIQKNWLEAYSKLRELVNGLKTENSELKERLYSVREELESAKRGLENSQSLAKSHILEAKSELSERIEALKELAKQVQQAPPAPPAPPAAQPMPQPVQPPVQQVIQPVSLPPSSFQRHIMSRVLPNRKGYVLKMIMDLVGENKYSTKELEEIVVNEKQLCGRTSFYAYIKELKLKGRLNYAEIDERSILVSTDTQQTLQ